MTTRTLTSLAAGVATALALMLTASADAPRQSKAPPNPEAEATYQAIKKAFGFVPTFVKAFPEVGIAAAWDELNAIELNPNTALSMKSKTLIGIAVAAQIPCRYCLYFDTESAKAAGVSDAEIKEAIAISAITRHWSTVLNGMQIDEKEFDKELVRVFAYVTKPHAPPPVEALTDAPSAYRDMEHTLGMVPTFFRAFPEQAIAAAWREFKGVQLSSETALPPKVKELIGLSVAAQVPCKYCITFHTTAAKANGATDNEIKEAVAMAALTRHWSTVLNGSLLDEPTFRKEVDQMLREVKKQNLKASN